MFTHKQAWRRQRRSEQSLRSQMRSLQVYRSQSLPDLRLLSSSESASSPRHHSMMQLSSPKDSPSQNDFDTNDHRRHSQGANNSLSGTKSAKRGKCKKSVSFSDSSRVVLVPSRAEYEKHGLLQDVWWDPEDYQNFKSSARMEIMEMLDEYKGNVHSALTALYQPDFDTMSPVKQSVESVKDSENNEDDTASRMKQNDIESGANSQTDEFDINSLPVCDNSSEQQEDELFHRTGKTIKPADLLSCVPPQHIRMPRDSLRKESSNKTVKQVHPLALMTS